jgi:Uma2 family endonuclease
MPTLLRAPASRRTLADLLHDLGDIPPERVLLRPPPGTATEADVIALEERENRLCELVDGVLVEKVMGLRESLLAVALAGFLREFAMPRNLGLVSGADGMMRLFPGLVRIPDVAFASWQRVPGGRVPSEPVPGLVPDLAVEVLSAGNTEEEMTRKRTEYFGAGVRLVWLVDPENRTVTVYTGPDQAVVLDESATLDGGEVLPGFNLRLRDLFAELDRRANG